MHPIEPGGPPGSARARAYHIIFDSDRGWARRFDVVLIIAILASVLAVMLDSVAGIRAQYGGQLRTLEWAFTILFTAEYALRLWSVKRPSSYALSFFGIIDVLAVLPTYLSLVAPGGQFLAVIRVLRVMRVFRVLKLARYVGEASVLAAALRSARYKISVFVVGILTVVCVVGSLMYIVEGPESGFTSIPRGVYWAIVTLTTVGYGDIAPQTSAGQALAAFVMILGYGVIAVPTGIVTAELTAIPRAGGSGRSCHACRQPEPEEGAAFCRWCGTRLA
jgi:voltage-gated potassium channel